VWPAPVGLLVVFTLLAVACGGLTQGIQDGVHLNFIGQLYQRCLTANKKPPSGPDDLLPLAKAQEEKDAVQAIKDGKLTIIWDVNLNDDKQFPDGKSNTVLGYANATLGGARQVLMADGKFTTLDDADFQKKTQAKPAPPFFPAAGDDKPAPAEKGDKAKKGKDNKKL